MPGYVVVVAPSAVVLILGIVALLRWHPEDVAAVLRAIFGHRD